MAKIVLVHPIPKAAAIAMAKIRWEAEEEIGDSHHSFVHFRTRVCGDPAVEDSKRSAHDHHHKAGGKRNPRSHEDPRETSRPSCRYRTDGERLAEAIAP